VTTALDRFACPQSTDWDPNTRKVMRKFLITGMAVAMLAVPSAAMADAPDGTYNIVPVANENASAIGKQSSQIHQNGQFVSGKWTGLDGWQDQRGDRSAIVQAALGHVK